MGTQRTLDSDRRWKGRFIPWSRDPGLNGMASTLTAGMRMIEDKTHLRFIRRTNEHDHIFFKPGNGCSSEEVGREVKIFRTDGGQLEITIDSWANAGVVAHEICHALGMFHEQCRQDRSLYISIDWDNIKDSWKAQYEKYDSSTGRDIGPYDFESIMHYSATNNSAKDESKPIITVKDLAQVKRIPGAKGYTGDPAKMGQRDYLTDGDIAAINGLPRGILHINKINPDGSIGMRTDTRDWSDGWTHALTLIGANTPYLFILKKLTGIVHIHKLTNEVISPQVVEYDWSADWSSVDTVNTAGKTFLLLLRVSDGNIHVHEMNSNGTIGAQTDTQNWSSGYTTGRLFTVGSNAFLFILKKGDGIVKIHTFGADGKIGAKVGDYDWSGGWSSVCFTKAGSATYMVLLKEDDGEIHVHRMEPNGQVGPQTDKKNWTQGYTQLISYKASGVTYLLALKRSDGTVKIHPLDSQGRIGNLYREYNWRSGWGSVATYAFKGQSYLVLLRERY